MQITRQSMFSGVERTLDLPVTQEQIDRWKGGELAQNVFSHLTADQREFIMTGVTAEEWAETFGEDESEDECEDCNETYTACECGTDPSEYPDVDYLGAYNALEDTDWSY